MINISNYYEQLVIDKLWELSEVSENPFTQSFLEDVACLALNNLPTCYVRSLVDKGATMTEQDHQQIRTTVGHAIERAMEQVRRHPHENRYD
ncbi:late competence development ComFB family protein [Methylomonas sp. LL1]|uniref:late competence development ComFB family protein n=1 Tax=Methylomonas sp. LL1 TaxID=2785785 RepID=UPI0018C3E1DE|nr:late competence development ComFB family protein [Methylomonas sp. LL1]QPK62615.1 late competence development ComFB family protein [Methylomonas sp. LL1]